MMTKEYKARVLVFAGLFSSLAFIFLRPQNFPFDDGFFYLQIARNIVQLGQSSFHTITPTNGYHPLWMGICVLITYGITAMTPSATALLDAVIFVQILLLLAGFYFLVKLERELGLKHSSMSISILVCLFVGEGTFLLLETELALTLLIYASYRYVLLTKRHSYSIGEMAWFSFVLGLLVLTRLDMVFFAGLSMLGLLVRYAQRLPIGRIITRSLALVLPCAMMVGLYMLANHAVFGSYLPVSGLIKGNMPGSVGVDPMRPTMFENYFRSALVPIICFVFFILCGKGFMQGRSRHQRAGCFLVEMGFYCIVHAAYTVFFGFAAAWYFIQQYLLFSIFGNYIFSQRPVRTRERLVMVVAALMACANIFVAYNNYRPDNGPFSYDMQRVKKHREQAAELLKNAVSPHAGVLVFDVPGMLAYYDRQLRIFPTDGLVSDFSYNDELLREGVPAYYCKRDIQYLYAPLVTDGSVFYGLSMELQKSAEDYRLTLFAPRTKQKAGTLILPAASLIAHLPNTLGINEKLELGVWKLPCP